MRRMMGMQHRVNMASPKLRIQPRSTRVQITCIFVVALSYFVFRPLLVSLSQEKHQHEVGPTIIANPMPSKNVDAPRDMAELLEKLAAATRNASNGRNMSELFTPAKQALWHKEHPCASRYEIYSLYSSRKIARDSIETNPKWNSVLREYANLHRTCVQQMGDVTNFFLRRKHINGCKFVVAGVSAGSGIGNKALSIVSALLYAVLTQRVLLVPQVTAVPGVFCEPFEGSSWMVDPEQVWAESKKRQDLWDSLESFYRKVDARDKAHLNIKPIYAVSTTKHWDAQPEPRFFCDTEQAHYTQVEWINFRNNLYFVPKLFAVPSFRPVLEDIFPNRKVFTHLLRTVMLPCNPVWGRVKQVHYAHFQHSDRRIGIQERYFHGKDDFDLLHAVTEDNVVSCLVLQGLLPIPQNRATQGKLNDLPQSHPISNPVDPLAPLRVTTIFIASLYQSLANRLTKDYIRTHLDSGDAVGLVQLTHEDQQYFGVEVDRQALAEILCLSLTDHLVLTPQSTFGTLAQGYGGLVPWFIDLRPNTPTPCVRAQSTETCYQIPATKLYTCPHDVNVNGQFMTDVVPYLSDCHLVEKPFVKVNGADLGMQLLTTM
ncbi:hypothetical protein M758_7G144700 [Ceratodon purpureus]|nr:hypothetical protein M758_7G144700 [Ceratodon purpureus]